ncbi:MAG: PAS domain S-box protein [Anaerolineales bacterium]
MSIKSDSDLARGGADEPLGSEQDFRLLVETVKDYAIVLLDPQGNVVTWNEGARRIKGYATAEIVGKNFSIFYPPEDIERGKPALELKAAATDGRFEDEGWRLRKDGSRFWANVIMTALFDTHGTLRGFGKVTRDLTERKRAEELQIQNLAAEAMARRAQEILDIATPVVRVWEGIILVPLIGSLDSQRTQQLMEKLLEGIVETRSSIALVDITGVPAIDTQTARHLVESISAVRLLGADVILTGVRPAIAQTLVHLGIDLTGVTTRASLSAGLLAALDTVGLRVASKA